MILPVEANLQDIRPEAEGFIQSALDTLPDHIAILDQNFIIIGVNAAWHQLSQESVVPLFDDGMGLHYFAACEHPARMKLPPEYAVAEGMRELVGGYRDLLEMEYRCGNNETFVVRARRFGWQDDLRLTVAHENITALKRHRQQTGTQEIAARTLLDKLSEAVFTLTSSGEILYCNAAAARTFGYGKFQMRGMSFSDLLAEQGSVSDVRCPLLRETNCNLQGRRSDNSLFPMRVSIDEARVKDRDTITIVVSESRAGEQNGSYEQDFTRLHDMLREERLKQQVKDQCLSMMSHELRTPLTSIQLSHDMLAQYGERATPEERRQFLDNIRQQVKNLNEILSDVVSLSKSKQSELSFNPLRQDLVAFCRELIESFQINYQHTHEIEFDCQCDRMMAEFDERHLRRALTNLLFNAIKYSPDGGVVRLRLWRQGDEARLTLSDQGIGIPDEDKELLFQAFHRAANVGALPGSGLGLAVAKQALDLHDGEIRFTSAIGIGSTFEVLLPLRTVAAH